MNPPSPAPSPDPPAMTRTVPLFSPGRVATIAGGTVTQLVRMKTFYFLLAFALPPVGVGCGPKKPVETDGVVNPLWPWIASSLVAETHEISAPTEVSEDDRSLFDRGRHLSLAITLGFLCLLGIALTCYRFSLPAVFNILLLGGLVVATLFLVARSARKGETPALLRLVPIALWLLALIPAIL